jgi:hypothetical protein
LCLLFLIKSEYSQDQSVVNTFKDHAYTELTTDEDMYVIRVFPTQQAKVGHWVTTTLYTSKIQAREFLSLPPTNRACSVAVVKIKKGTTLLIGTAAPGAWTECSGQGKQHYEFINFTVGTGNKQVQGDKSKIKCLGGGEQIYLIECFDQKDIIEEKAFSDNVHLKNIDLIGMPNTWHPDEEESVNRRSNLLIDFVKDDEDWLSPMTKAFLSDEEKEKKIILDPKTNTVKKLDDFKTIKEGVKEVKPK